MADGDVLKISGGHQVFGAPSGGGGVTVTGSQGGSVAGATTLNVAAVSDSGGGVVAVSAVVVADDDPGAIGAKNLWLQTDPDGNFNTLQLWVRNDTDDGWLEAAAGSSYSDSGLADAGFWDQVTGREYASMSIDAGSRRAQFVVRADPADTSTVRSLRVDTTGVRLVAGSTIVYQIVGTADPSAGAGVVAGPGSTYQRNNSGTGELWLKTAAGDTAWSKVTTS